MTQDPDEALRALLARDHPDAWTVLVELWAPAMLAVARSITSTVADAEAPVPPTFLDLFSARRAFARAARPRAYAFRALHHAAARLRRRNQPIEPFDEVHEPAATPGESRTQDLALAGALARLSVEQREVLALKIDGDLTFDEVGAALGVSPDTVASRYRRALERLRDRLGART